ncbi:unnamed protein product [Lathyrus oleraceus]
MFVADGEDKCTKREELKEKRISYKKSFLRKDKILNLDILEMTEVPRRRESSYFQTFSFIQWITFLGRINPRAGEYHYVAKLSFKRFNTVACLGLRDLTLLHAYGRIQTRTSG